MYKITFVKSASLDQSTGNPKTEIHIAKYSCDNQLKAIAENWKSLGFVAVSEIEIDHKHISTDLREKSKQDCKLNISEVAEMFYTAKMIKNNPRLEMAKRNLLRLNDEEEPENNNSDDDKLAKANKKIAELEAANKLLEQEKEKLKNNNDPKIETDINKMDKDGLKEYIKKNEYDIALNLGLEKLLAAIKEIENK